MIEAERFHDWLKGADSIFESLEGRDDTYNISSRWVDEWFKEKVFHITNSDRGIMDQIPQNILLYDSSIENNLRTAYKSFMENLNYNNNKLSYAFSSYLMTWNIRRFEEYFRNDNNFDLSSYFDSLNDKLQDVLIDNLIKIREKHILQNEPDERLIRNCFEGLNTILKESSLLNQNEPIGTIKILHIIAPKYLPLLDNAIARALKFSNLCNFFQFSGSPEVGFIVNCINKSSYDFRTKGRLKRRVQECMQRMIVDSESYFQYMKWARKLLEEVADEVRELEKETDKSSLKLLDEAFYVRYSINILRRLG